MGEAAIKSQVLGSKHKEDTIMRTSDSPGIGHLFPSGREARTLTYLFYYLVIKCQNTPGKY